MLEDHQRAAMMPNDVNVTWHHFVQSRFVGKQEKRKGMSLTVDIQAVQLESHSHAAIRGLLEYSTDSSLPIVFEFVGTLLLDSREVLIDDADENVSERSYTGSLSENGRVLTLRPRDPGKSRTPLVHLIHEGTAAELFAI